MTYAEKLKDPRWQKKRLEIMERDGWTCQICGATEKPLHTHHLVYIEGREPWDYSPPALQCLCEDCNRIEGRVPVITAAQIESVNTMISCICAQDYQRINLWEVALNVAKNALRIHQITDSAEVKEMQPKQKDAEKTWEPPTRKRRAK